MLLSRSATNLPHEASLNSFVVIMVKQGIMGAWLYELALQLLKLYLDSIRINRRKYG